MSLLETEDAAALREKAEALRRSLRGVEQTDWPRWLREADQVTREISELLRRACALEHQL